MVDIKVSDGEEERAFIDLIEAADPDRLAELLRRPTRDEEEVLVTYFGQDRYHTMHELALARGTRGAAQAPIGSVVVLHGIMGGALTGVNLRGRNTLLWVAALRILGGGLPMLELNAEGLRDLRDDVTVHASGILKRHYGELLLSLSGHWRVRAFWFDWRKDLRVSARALATAITGWFPAKEPVHLVAHSMGGLVARTFIAESPDLWTSMWDHKSDGRRGGRLIMLGTPNHGSFDIPRVMVGNERMVKLLALADFRLSMDRLRQILNTFVGTYQMLPSPFEVRSVEALYRAQTYAPVQVSQRHLDTAREHHERLRSVVDPARMIYVAGGATRTYTGFNAAASPLDDDSYQLGMDGDGRVPHALGLLASEAGDVPTFYAPTTHGGLTRHRDVLGSMDDLLTSGATQRLAQSPPTVRTTTSEPDLHQQQWKEDEQAEAELRSLVRRLGTRSGTGRRVRGAPAPSMDNVPEAPITDLERQLEDLLVDGWLSRGGGVQTPAFRFVAPLERPEIRIDLEVGDIGNIHAGDADPKIDAIAVGHYLGVVPQAAERALDLAISGSVPEGASSGPGEQGLLTQLTLRGTIMGSLGQPFFLPDPREPSRLLAIAGMDVPGRFGVGELIVVARELCWAIGRLGRHHLASVLIGAGNGNLSPTQAVESWLTGLAQALSGQLQDTRLQRLTFVEEDPRRLQEIDSALSAARDRMSAEGRLKVDYAPADETKKQRWRQLAREHDIKDANKRWESDVAPEQRRDPIPGRMTITRDGDTFRFGAITTTAAIPEREIPLDPALVIEANDQLAAEPEGTVLHRNGLYLGKLLFPADLEFTLRGSPLVLMLDSSTARIHWELLTRTPPQAPGSDQTLDLQNTYLGISAGVTRQLRTVFAQPPEPPPPPERRLRVLVVADPAEDAPLPGAEEEGILVADLFERFNTHDHPDRVDVVRLFGPREASRTAVLRALMTRHFHVLHFAGHCFYDKDYPPGSGWIFTNGAVLSARELRRIDRVPEFIFSNACESGVTPDRSGKRSAGLAPSFAEAFFARGVGNFVCTAWPVDDQAASQFAATLYRHLLGIDQSAGRPKPMYEAMKEARRALAGSRTGGARSWGAYQHYGDPLYRLVADRSSSTAGGQNGVATDEGQQAGTQSPLAEVSG